MKIVPLNSEILRESIEHSRHLRKYEFHFLESVDSTNDFLGRQLEQSPRHLLAIARQQTDGRGRFDRHWNSSIPDNIYLSLGFPELPTISQLQSFSMRYAEAVVKNFENHLHISLQIKPPNDLLLNGRKIAGILLESRQKIHCFILGIGMNLWGGAMIQTLCDQPVGALDETQIPLNSNEIAILLAELADRLQGTLNPPGDRPEPEDSCASTIPRSSIRQ